jgi:hypothetical protein
MTSNSIYVQFQCVFLKLYKIPLGEQFEEKALNKKATNMVKTFFLEKVTV